MKIRVPINWEHFLIVIDIFFNVDLHNSCILSTLDFIKNTVKVTEYKRNSIHWVGGQTDITGFISKTNFVRNVPVAFKLLQQDSLVSRCK